jgi:hypothetical protein
MHQGAGLLGHGYLNATGICRSTRLHVRGYLLLLVFLKKVSDSVKEKYKVVVTYLIFLILSSLKVKSVLLKLIFFSVKRLF